MARRYFGDLAINVLYEDISVNGHYNYKVSVSGHGATWRGRISPPASAIGFAYDSPIAYDDVARAAVNYATMPDGSESAKDRETMSVLDDAANSGPHAGQFHRPKTGSKKNPSRRSRRNPASAYDVYLNGRLFDTVFFNGNFTTDTVKSSLVNHDGYDPRIVVKKQRKR